MKRFVPTLTVAAVLVSSNALAADPSNEIIQHSVEVDSFIVNYNPSGKILGRVMASLCDGCPTQTLIFDQSTLFEIDGQLRPIEDIKKQAEWSGVITVTNQAPEKIIKFSIF